MNAVQSVLEGRAVRRWPLRTRRTLTHVYCIFVARLRGMIPRASLHEAWHSSRGARRSCPLEVAMLEGQNKISNSSSVTDNHKTKNIIEQPWTSLYGRYLTPYTNPRKRSFTSDNKCRKVAFSPPRYMVHQNRARKRMQFRHMDDTERSVFNIVATFHSTEDATKAEAPVIKKVSEFCRQ